MDEKFLIKISIICAVVGLIALFFISNTLESKSIEISQITPDDLGETVKVCGNVMSKYISKNGHVFLRIDDGSADIKIVIFNNTVSKLGINPDNLKDEICLIGKVDIYEDELEIILRKLE